MSDEESKKWLADLVSKPVSPTIEAEFVLEKVIEYYSAWSGFKQITELDIPASNGDRRSVVMFQFGMLMGEFKAMMSLFVEMTGEPPSGKLWDAAALRVAKRMASGK